MSEEKYATLNSEKGSDGKKKEKKIKQIKCCNINIATFAQKQGRFEIAKLTWEDNNKTYLKGIG
jgi:hypothetical protein